MVGGTTVARAQSVLDNFRHKIDLMDQSLSPGSPTSSSMKRL